MYRIVLLFLAYFSLSSQEFRGDGKFPYPLNTQNAEYSPIIAPNSRYIVFQSNRPGGAGGMDLWISENKNYRNRTGTPSWGEPQNFRELNTPDFEGPFSILFDSDGRPSEIYFTSQKSSLSGRDGLKGLNIYYTRNSTGKNPSSDKWTPPVHLLEVNSNFEDKMPAISPDGKSLVFSSNRPGGYGGFDLWVSYRDTTQNKWTNPVNLGSEINSQGNEIMPSFHYDGATIYFSSDRKDENYKFSFYSADLEDETLLAAEDGLERPKNPNRSPSLPKVKEVKKLSMPFNSKHDDEGISLTHDGLWVYFSSNRPGGEGQFDIYRAPITDEMRKPYAFQLSGIVVDGSEDTMIGLDATIKITNEKGMVRLLTSKRIGGDITSKKSESEITNFKTKLLTNYKYKIEVSSPGFHPNEFLLDLTGNVGFGKSKFVRVVLMPVKEEVEEKETKPVPSPSPVSPAQPKKEEPKNDNKPTLPNSKVLLKDFETKLEISEGTVKLVTEPQKEGLPLKKSTDGGFEIESLPPGTFELTGTAKGYTTETLTIAADDKISREKKIFEIFLKKAGTKENLFEKIVLFDFSESKLKDDQISILNEFLAFLKSNPKDLIEVSGHTDNIDSKEFNTKLSQKRADVVKEYLVTNGIDPKRILTKALWFSQPVADNSTEEGRAQNRRVTFKKATKKD